MSQEFPEHGCIRLTPHIPGGPSAPHTRESLLRIADSTYSTLGTAVTSLENTLAQVGRILTCGCDTLGEDSLGLVMSFGQQVKELLFATHDLQLGAFNLCISLSNSLGIPMADRTHFSVAVEPDPEEDDDGIPS